MPKPRYALVLLLLAVLLLPLLTGCAGSGGPPSQFATMQWDSITLVYRLWGIPVTLLRNPRVEASGKVGDEAVIVKAMEVTGKSRDDVVALLRSYDTTGSNLVRVLQLRMPMQVTRYWSDPTAKLGRWYSPSQHNRLHRPDQARRLYALPRSNRATFVTLYRLKTEAAVIDGVCADMTWNPEVFGPYATGGGGQYYAPDATKWVTDHAELNPKVIALVSELRWAQN